MNSNLSVVGPHTFKKGKEIAFGFRFWTNNYQVYAKKYFKTDPPTSRCFNDGYFCFSLEHVEKKFIYPGTFVLYFFQKNYFCKNSKFRQ